MSVLKHTYEQNMNKTRGLMGDVGRAAAAESCRFYFGPFCAFIDPFVVARMKSVRSERASGGGKGKKEGPSSRYSTVLFRASAKTRTTTPYTLVFYHKYVL